MAQDQGMCEVRLMAEIHVPEGDSVRRVDMYGWLSELLGDWAMQDPEALVKTTGTFDPDGEKIHDRELVVDIICAKDTTDVAPSTTAL